MENIVGAIIVSIIASVCFVFSYLQFKEKGFLLKNLKCTICDKECRLFCLKIKHIKVSFLLLWCVFYVIGNCVYVVVRQQEFSREILASLAAEPDFFVISQQKKSVSQHHTIAALSMFRYNKSRIMKEVEI